MSSLNVSPIPTPTTRTVALCGILAAEAAVLLLPGKWWGIAGLLFLALAVLLGLLVVVLRGSGESVILGWILMFPLGYYYLSFPREGALFTLDRFVIGTLLASVCFAFRRDILRVPRTLRKSGVYWAWFLLFAALAASRAKTPLSSLRIWLEAFLFPALLAWYILRYFDVRRFLPTLHALTCVMAIYVTAIGFAEVILLRDLLPLPGGGFTVAGDSVDLTATLLPRPNGPFATNNSFAMVGMVSLFFLLFLRKALAEQMSTWQKILHGVGVSAALLEALLPLFKSVLVSLAAVVLIDVFYQHSWRRMLRLGAIVLMGVIFLSLQMVFPSVFEERTGAGTLQARIAQQKQTLALFIDHPINGVGLSNFTDALQNSKYITYYDDAEALGSAHNNLGAVLAETGLTGFLPFVASQVCIVGAFWTLGRARSGDSKLVWRTFLFLFLGYWINGMALTTAYYADLNLWYMFVLAVLYKFAITSSERETVASRQLAPQL